MDKLKQYLQQHIEHLNIDEPTEEVWQKIKQQSLPPKPIVTSIVKYLRYAAAACVIMLSIIGLKTILSKQPTNTNVTTTNNVNQPQPIVVQPQPTVHPVVTTPKPKPQAVNNTTNNKHIQNEFITTAVEKIDAQFVQVINTQKNKINNTPLYAENETYFKDFAQQMKQLDKDEIAVRKTIHSTEFNFEMLNGLITIYQQKLFLLKSLQTEINKLNTKYKTNKEPADTVHSYFISI